MKYVDVTVRVGAKFLRNDAPLDKGKDYLTRKVSGFPEPESDDDLPKLMAEIRKWHKQLPEHVRPMVKLDKLPVIHDAVRKAIRLQLQNLLRPIILAQFGADEPASAAGESKVSDVPEI